MCTLAGAGTGMSQSALSVSDGVAVAKGAKISFSVERAVVMGGIAASSGARSVAMVGSVG